MPLNNRLKPRPRFFVKRAADGAQCLMVWGWTGTDPEDTNKKAQPLVVTVRMSNRKRELRKELQQIANTFNRVLLGQIEEVITK